MQDNDLKAIESEVKVSLIKRGSTFEEKQQAVPMKR
jgi:hypothetical protein